MPCISYASQPLSSEDHRRTKLMQALQLFKTQLQRQAEKLVLLLELCMFDSLSHPHWACTSPSTGTGHEQLVMCTRKHARSKACAYKPLEAFAYNAMSPGTNSWHMTRWTPASTFRWARAKSAAPGKPPTMPPTIRNSVRSRIASAGMVSFLGLLDQRG